MYPPPARKHRHAPAAVGAHLADTRARHNELTFKHTQEFTMKTTITIAALALALSASAAAVAQDGLSREQVRAEVLAARAAGTLSSGGEGYQATTFTPSVRTRAAVKAELAAARAAGTIAEGEAYPGPLPAAEGTPRAAVRAELAAARVASTLLEGGGTY
jgi:hypothetical protein